MKRVVSGLICILLFIGLWSFAFKIQPVNARTIIVPDNYPNLSQAINAASDGDTIFVRNGIYYESVNVGKSLSLIGESMENTIIDVMGGSDVVINIIADNVNVTGFTLRNSRAYGIVLTNSSHDTIAGNNITATGNGNGIALFRASNYNIVSGNRITGGLINIFLRYSCWYNTIVENEITDFPIGCGIGFMDGSDYNSIYHNSFFGDPTGYVHSNMPADVWDGGYPAGGNYWGGYNGTDVYCGQYQNETGSDGIGDTPYYAVPYATGTLVSDNYPLMVPFNFTNLHIPIVDPSIAKLPFRMTLEPEGDNWTLDADGKLALTATLLDVIGESADALAQIWPDSHVDIAVKVWNFVLADTNGDKKLDATEIRDQLIALMKDELRDQTIKMAQLHAMEVSYGLMDQESLAILGDFAEFAGLACGGLLMASRLASLSFAGVSMVVGLPVLNPCMFMTVFGGEYCSAWSRLGTLGDGATSVYFYCPGDLTIRDESGLVVNKTLSQIPGASYSEKDLDGDGETDALISLPSTAMNYTLDVIPKEGANPNDTCTLIVGYDWAAFTVEENTTISEISNHTYSIAVHEMLTSPDVALENVTSSKSVVGRGLEVGLNVVCKNQGNYTEILDVTAYADSTCVASQNVTLEGGDSTNFTLTWNTTGSAYGNYTINVCAAPIPGETNTANNNFTGATVKVTIAGDINGDFTVDIYDAIILAGAYNSKPGDTNWKPNADINGDNIVDIYDAIILAGNFNQHYP